MDRSTLFKYVGPALLVAGLAVSCLLVVLLLVGGGADPMMPPTVEITRVSPSERTLVNQPVLIMSQAQGPRGVTAIELWVNAERVTTQSNPSPAADQPFATQQAWHPTGPGSFAVIVRAIGPEGRASQSSVVMIEAFEDEHTTPEGATMQVTAGADDTLDELADKYGTTTEELAERNPQLDDQDPSPGDSVYVPQPEDSDGDDDGEDNAGSGTPGVNPGGGGGGGGGQPVGNARPPWWSGAVGNVGGIGSPLDPGFLCRLAPTLCNRTEGSQQPAAPPTGVGIEQVGDCQVEVSWVDQTVGEGGYYIDRYLRGNTESERVANLDPVDGEGQRRTYTDVVPGPGEYFYLVQSHRAGNSTPGAPTTPLSVPCEQPPGDKVAVEIEALSLRVPADTNLLHCYVSLAGLPITRIPQDPGQFLEVSGGSTDIDHHFGGENSARLLVDPEEELTVGVKCVALERPTPQNGLLPSPPSLRELGRFENAHPSAQWDGRELTGEAATGMFTFTYRIQPSSELRSAPFQFIDSALEAPEIVGREPGWNQCRADGAAVPRCTYQDQDALRWTWSPPEEASGRLLHRFRVVARAQGREEEVTVYSSDPIPLEFLGMTRSGPLLTDSDVCDRLPVTGTDRADFREYSNVNYFVEAGLYESSEGEWVVSPLSDPLPLIEWCEPEVALKITLEHLDLVFGAPDLEVYGEIFIGPYAFQWNQHPIPEGLLLPEFAEAQVVISPPPYTSSVTAGRIPLANQWLRIRSLEGGDVQLGGWQASSDFSPDNHVVYVPWQEGKEVNVAVTLWDHDGGQSRPKLNSDDMICLGLQHSLPERTASEWYGTDETFSSESIELHARCIITVRVEGMRLDEIQP